MTLRVVDIAALDLPGLEPYRSLRRSEEHERLGVFVAEGGGVVERLLDSDLEVVSALLSPRWLAALAARLAARHEEIRVFVGADELLSSIVGFHLHQGVMALARIPTAPPLTSTLDRALRPRLVVALDRVANAENLGVIARSCAAFAVDALVVGETSSSPWLRRAVRVSMGSIFRLRVHFAASLVAVIGELRAAGFLVVAATPDGESLHGVDLGRDCCVVLGHEERGVRPEVRSACERALAIPMPGGIDSLNVATAAAVLLYEVRRQWGTGAAT
jgi:tRNA G18 (ribose-2'-O)-methylase SpoU